jgi:uncharacterized coiled-coil DUF342 family protein
LRVETLRSKFDAARKALQDFRDRQTELGGDLAPTADEIERLNAALNEMAESVPPPVRSIALLNSELKTLKDELENAEIGSQFFFDTFTKIEAKAKEIEAAMRSLRMSMVEDPGVTLMDPKAIDKIAGVSLKSLNEQLAEAKKRKEEAFEFSAEFDKAIADIDRLEKRIKDFGDTQIDVGASVKANVVENIQDEADIRKKAFEDARNEFVIYAQAVQSLIQGISEAQAAASRYELGILQDQLDQGMIGREEYDQQRKRIMRKEAMDAKALALLNAIIGTAAGIANALPNIPLSIIAGVLGAIQIGVVASQPLPQFAKGVIDLKGAGTETSDSIHARLSRGESVMTANETRQHRPILEAIRKGTLERMIAETYVRPAVDSAMLSGFADMGRSADLNGLTAKL